MTKIEASFTDVNYLDILSAQDTPVHRVEPRMMLLTTLAFILAVMSFDKYALAGLVPFVLYPTVLIAAGNLPLAYLARKVLVALPFALLIGAFNPLLDRTVLVRIGSVGISGGWISFASLLLRFCLTVTAAVVLVAITGFEGFCRSLERLGAPRAFVVQLLFLYRYLFVLGAEAARMERARSLRSFGSRGRGLHAFASLLGQLLLRTLERARRIHQAMRCRGFDGELRTLQPRRIGGRDIMFFVGWTALFILLRLYDVATLAGTITLRLMR